MSDEVDPWAEMAIALRDPADIERARDLARTIPLGPGPDGRTALQLAASAGADEVGRILLERGADPSLAQSGDWPPVRSAALSGSASLVRALIERGALVGRRGVPVLVEAAEVELLGA